MIFQIRKSDNHPWQTLSEVESGLVISQNVEADTRYNEGAITDIILTVSLGSEDVQKSDTDDEDSSSQTSDTGVADGSSQTAGTGVADGSSQTSSTGAENGSSKTSGSGKKNSTAKSSGKDYDVKSDGNEQVDFYLDDWWC